MVTANELAGFLVRTAASIARLNLALEPDDLTFRELAISEMVEGMPVPRPLDGVREQLLTGADPVKALSLAFSQQACVFSEAAAGATLAVVEEAVQHLHAAGGDAAVDAFLGALQDRAEAPAA